jgi:hypothetical protein
VRGQVTAFPKGDESPRCLDLAREGHRTLAGGQTLAPPLGGPPNATAPRPGRRKVLHPQIC